MSGTVIGTRNGKAYALLYNGILADRSVDGGNVLTTKSLAIIREDLAKAHPDFEGDIVVYAASTPFGVSRQAREGIIFKQTPYDISARG